MGLTNKFIPHFFSALKQHHRYQTTKRKQVTTNNKKQIMGQQRYTILPWTEMQCPPIADLQCLNRQPKKNCTQQRRNQQTCSSSSKNYYYYPKTIRWYDIHLSSRSECKDVNIFQPVEDFLFGVISAEHRAIK